MICRALSGFSPFPDYILIRFSRDSYSRLDAELFNPVTSTSGVVGHTFWPSECSEQEEMTTRIAA